jgi:phosphoribosylglycinamide formyltransferase-1
MSGDQARTKFAVLASGRGSNFEAIVKAISEGDLGADCVCLVCDQAGALVLEKAKTLKIPTVLVPEVKGETRLQYDERLFNSLQEFQPEYLVLAGFMRILSASFIDRYTSLNSGMALSRIVNLHPSLLPAFPGRESYRQCFDYGCTVSGVSVHFVTPGVDQGPLCAQEAFDIRDCTTVEQVVERGQGIERRLLPKTLEWIFKKNYKLEKRGERICVR